VLRRVGAPARATTPYPVPAQYADGGWSAALLFLSRNVRVPSARRPPNQSGNSVCRPKRDVRFGPYRPTRRAASSVERPFRVARHSTKSLVPYAVSTKLIVGDWTAKGRLMPRFHPSKTHTPKGSPLRVYFSVDAHEQGSSDAGLAQCLIPIIRMVAGTKRIAAASIQSELERANIQRWDTKRRSSVLLKLARDHRLKVQFGRFRGVLLTGVADLGNDFLTAFERKSLLLPDERASSRFGDFLAALQTELAEPADRSWDYLAQRITTYHTYHLLLRDTGRDDAKAQRLLTSRPRHALKSVLSLVNLAFLQQHFRVALPESMERRLKAFGTAEDISRIGSALVARANERRPLDSRDFAIPSLEGSDREDLWSLMAHGQALVARHEIGKKISLFAYRLELRRTSKPRVYCLVPPSREFEYSFRLGYMRAEINSGWLGISDLEDVPRLSLSTLTDMFFKRWQNKVCKIMDEGTPYRRVRLEFPIHPDLIRYVTSIAVFDDIMYRELLAQEFMFPVRLSSGSPDGAMPLTETLSIDEFFRIWRLLRFMALLDIASIRPYSETDETMFLNSSVRISREHEMVNLLTAMGFDAAKVSEFFRLTSASVDFMGYYDMQYKPFLRIAQSELPASQGMTLPEIVHLSAVVATANVLRNVQVTNELRLHYVAEAFVEIVATSFRQSFERVTTNRRVKAPTGNTDVDIVIWTDDAIYLFECKHSVSPAELHEARDVWQDIENGAIQLSRACEALSDPARLRDYLAGWFPGRKLVGKPRLAPCVLSSHRIFSGLHHNGIPVRDYASLAKLLEGGVIATATGEDPSDVLVQRYRLIAGDRLSAGDLDDYLSPNAKYFKMYAPFMRQMSSLIGLHGVTIAYETYVYQMEPNDWEENLEGIGASRLADERRHLKVPLTMEQVLAESNGGEGAPPFQAES
jgi:hypothetical protein